MEAPQNKPRFGFSFKDIGQFIVFVILVFIGSHLLNTFIFRSFTVQGQSMENTLHTNDRLIVDRVPSTMASLKNDAYTPERNQIIVFKNPQYVAGTAEEFVVKRVVGFAGERVRVENGVITVFNKEHPEGFNPDKLIKNGTPTSPISGFHDATVPAKNLFVVGDNREGSHSCDSRGCLGYIPLFDVIGPVRVRIWPLTGISLY